MRIPLPVAILFALLTFGALAEPLDINTADAVTLARELKGIGPTRANAIVAYRSAHGPFRAVDELTLVEGIGQKVIDANRALLRVGAQAAARPVAKVPPPRSNR